MIDNEIYVRQLITDYHRYGFVRCSSLTVVANRTESRYVPNDLLLRLDYEGGNARFEVTLRAEKVRHLVLSPRFLDQLEFCGLEVLDLRSQQHEGVRYRLFQLESNDFLCDCFALAFTKIEERMPSGQLEPRWEDPYQ